jgi:phage terminase small subunit
MKIIKGSKKQTHLTKLPKCSPELNDRERKIYRQIGMRLIRNGNLREIDITILETLSTSLAEFYWATERINEMNAKKMGDGYIQKYASGATNITTHMVIRERAFDKFIRLSKLLGMSIKDRYSMAELYDMSKDQLEFEFDTFRQAK